MGLFDLTQNQLVKATQVQILTKINDKLNAMPERRLKEFVWYLRDLIVEDLNYQEEVLVESIDCPNGQVLRVKETRDLMGNVIGKERQEWTYYPPQPDGKCPVDVYIKTIMDQNGNVISVSKLKYFIDGRQPQVLT